MMKIESNIFLIMSTEEIVIDGSYGEGGGRMFRDSVMYGMICAATEGWRGKLTINNIRMSRPKPGIKNSLLGMIDFCRNVFPEVQANGIHPGSLNASLDFSEVSELEPGDESKTISVNANGLGSAWLLFLAIHPFMTKVKQAWGWTVSISGGTDVFFPKDKLNPHTLTPPTRYMKEVWLHNINIMHDVKSFHIAVHVVREHKDLQNGPSIIISPTRYVKTTMSVDGLTERDGTLLISSSLGDLDGPLHGCAHPYYKYPEKLLREKLQTTRDQPYDEHFSDMVVPYQMNLEPEDTVSKHHDSALYVMRAFPKS